MTYGTQFTFASIAATSMATTVLRVNSVYDPDLSGGGTSVAGYAAAAGLYGRSRVLSFKAFLTFLPTTMPIMGFVVVSPDSTLGTDYPRALAQRHITKFGMQPGGPPINRTVGGPIHLFAGVPAATVKNDDSFAALGATTPASAVYLHIGAYNATASTAAFTVSIHLELKVEWSLPLEIPQP
jgi:hypothetical protein